MNGHENLKEALASILHSGLVCLRGTAGQDASYVEAEASHLHNLPWCLARMRGDDIRYYHDTERPRYLSALRGLEGSSAGLAPDYKRAWGVIEAWLRQELRRSTSAPGES